MTRPCAVNGCEREALVSQHPDVIFNHCRQHTGDLYSQAFGAVPERAVRPELGVPPDLDPPADGSLQAVESLPSVGRGTG